jgi:membrane-associated phospholipid phosphatase
VLALLLLLSVSALTGVVAWAAVRRWPHADPAAAATHKVAEELEQAQWFRRFLRSRFDPAVATGLALTAALAGLVAAGAMMGVIVYMVRTSSGIVKIDDRFARWAADNVNGFSLRAITWITELGSTPVIVVLALAGAAYGYWRWRRPSIFAFLTIVVGGQFLLMNLIKFTVDRARPDFHRLSVFSGSSFPSGHSTAAATTFAALALVFGIGRSPSVRAALIGVGVSVAVAVASSRVLLGVHWFSDVIAGLALGWSWFGACAVAFGGRLLNFGEPAEEATSDAKTPDIDASTRVHDRDGTGSREHV